VGLLPRRQAWIADVSEESMIWRQRRASTVVVAASIGLLALASAPAAAQPWTPPLGVPMPSFGVSEQARAVPSPWNGETSGFYYVDNTHSLASDSVTFGSPARPRRSIPSSVAAGSVVEVHGGPYTTGVSIGIGGTGTAASPIFYRGVGKPQIAATSNQRSVSVSGAYVVVEGFLFSNLMVSLNGHHLSVRDNEMRGMPPAPGGTATNVGGSKDAVVLRNYIHNNGDPNYFDENDIHGVLVTSGAERVWIVDNEMHGNGGDSVQVNSQQGTLARLIYIARNRMHEEGENAVDIKTAEDVIISQNKCWGFRPTQFAHSGSDGTAIVVNDDNALNRLNNRIWILFNEIYSSTNGIRTQSYAYIAGNIIRQIDTNAIISFGPHDVHIEHNTIYSVGRAFERFAGEAGNKVYFLNNIVSTRLWEDIKVSGSASSAGSGSAVAYSLFPAPARLMWAGATYTSLSSFLSAIGCMGCREGDPRFANAAANDFRLLAGSPASANTTGSALYLAYQNQYGVNIAVDFAGRSRPGPDGQWDMGAHESDGGVAPPAAPTNPRILR
jgi:hypothetical protein